MTNAFKRRLAGQDHQTGLWLSLCHPTAAEICAAAGFDWLLIDAEHAPNDIHTILAQLRAIEPLSTAIVRPASGEPQHIRPLLDIGVQNLLIPMINDARQASELLRTVRYPPSGDRGHASTLTRASRYGHIRDYTRIADESICLIAQIETPQAVQAVEDISSIDGIDAVFVGLYDLSATLGHTNDPEHRDVQDALRTVVTAASRVDKPVGTLAPTPNLARIAKRAGCKLIAEGSDVSLLARAAHDLADSAGRLPGP